MPGRNLPCLEKKTVKQAEKAGSHETHRGESIFPLQECSDAGVARSKLAWWREEIGLLAEHRPRHPLSISLVPFLPDGYAWQAALLAIVESAETDVALPPFPQFEDVERYCAGRGGAL